MIDDREALLVSERWLFVSAGKIDKAETVQNNSSAGLRVWGRGEELK